MDVMDEEDSFGSESILEIYREEEFEVTLGYRMSNWDERSPGMLQIEDVSTASSPGVFMVTVWEGEEDDREILFRKFCDPHDVTSFHCVDDRYETRVLVCDRQAELRFCCHCQSTLSSFSLISYFLPHSLAWMIATSSSRLVRDSIF